MIKWIKSRFRGECCNCGKAIDIGDAILWQAKISEAKCTDCAREFFRWRDGG
jgi:hypothetical protein